MISVHVKKILWPIDILVPSEQHNHALFTLGAITRASGAQVEPVYVLSPPYASLSAEPSLDIEEAFHALAEKRLKEIVASAQICTMKPGKVLVNRLGSVREDVQCVLEYAEQTQSDTILVSTHARSGISRLIMGSFAETLVARSPLPTIAVNPATVVRERISKILWPTTFQSAFRPGFERIVDLAQELEAEVTLFYKEPLIPGHLMSPEIQEFVAREAKQRTSEAEEWQQWAAEKHVLVQIHLDNQPGYPGAAISEFAEDCNFDMIAMVSQASSASAMLLGSVARQVIRTAPCPVWVMKA